MAVSNWFPRNLEEREKIVQALQAERKKLTATNAIHCYDDLFKDTAEQFDETRKQVIQTRAAAKVAQEQCVKDDELLDAAARSWVATLLDEKGRSRAGELKTYLKGSTISGVLKLKPSVEIERLQDVFDAIETRTELRGDEARLEALKTAWTNLKASNEAAWNAMRAVNDTQQSFFDWTKKFDSAYRKLRSSWKIMLGEEAVNAMLPKFSRNPKGNKDDEEGESTEAKDKSADKKSANDQAKDKSSDKKSASDQAKS